MKEGAAVVDASKFCKAQILQVIAGPIELDLCHAHAGVPALIALLRRRHGSEFAAAWRRLAFRQGSTSGHQHGEHER